MNAILNEPVPQVKVGRGSATPSSVASLSFEAKNRLKRLQTFDLSFLEEQLTWKDGYPEEFASECVAEYRKWIALHIAMNDSDFIAIYFDNERPPLGMPSRYVDNTWHRHILFTKGYAEFCEAVVGKIIHHNPCTKRNVKVMNASATQRVYHILFGEMPEIWNEHENFLSGVNAGSGCGCGCDNRD